MARRPLNFKHDAINDARLKRLSRLLHRLGEYALFEFLRETFDEASNGGDLAERLDRFTGVNPQVVAALGLHKLPPIARIVEKNSR